MGANKKKFEVMVLIDTIRPPFGGQIQSFDLLWCQMTPFNRDRTITSLNKLAMTQDACIMKLKNLT